MNVVFIVDKHVWHRVANSYSFQLTIAYLCNLKFRSLKPLRPGIWHTVHISRTGRRIWMYVNDELPIEGSTPGGFTMLSLSQPLYLGGLPDESPARKLFTRDPNFEGCVQKVQKCLFLLIGILNCATLNF